MNRQFLFLAGLFILSVSACSTVKTNTKPSDMLHISALHEAGKSLSAKSLFKGQEGNTTALQLSKGGLLDKHTTKVAALLVCVLGEVLFEDEKGISQTLKPGDYIHIEPMVSHWVKGVKDSQLLLLK